MSVVPKTPDLDRVVWRYLSIDKYLDLLLSSSLKFTQVQIAADMLEVELMRHKLMKNGSFEGDERILEGSKIHIDKIRNTHYISCWTAKNKECRAFWSSYLGNSRIGVAIKSTVRQVIDSSDWNGHDYDYRLIDYKDDFEDLEELQDNTTLVNVKSEAYSSEEEIRFTIAESAVDWCAGPPRTKADQGFSPVIPICINLDKCINEVWVSPYCADWQCRMLKEITSKLTPNLSDRFRRSDINEAM